MGPSGTSGANKLDVSMLEWLGAVDITPRWPDWVRDQLSGPIVCDVPKGSCGSLHPDLTAVVTVTFRSVTS